LIEQAYPNGNLLIDIQAPGSNANLFTWWKANSTVVAGAH
jgi:hypothetical protein